MSPTLRYALAGMVLALAFILLGIEDWMNFKERRLVLAESTAQRGAEMVAAELQEYSRQGAVFREALPKLAKDLLRQDDPKARHAQLDRLLSEWFAHYRDHSLFPVEECPSRLPPTQASLCDGDAPSVKVIPGDPGTDIAMLLNLGDTPADRYMLLIHLLPARLETMLDSFSLACQNTFIYRRDQGPAMPGMLASANIPDTPWNLGVSTHEDLWQSERNFIVRRVGSAVLLLLLGTLGMIWLRRRADRMRAHGNALEATNVLLYEQATHDALTGLYNRHAFNEHVRRLVRHGQREKLPFALLAIDVDHFKQVNDHWGHEAGDQVLRRVAEAIGHSARRPLDMAARLGGEEFAVLLENAGPEDAWAKAELLRLHVADMRLPHPSGRHVSISVGVACGQMGPDAPLKDLLERADRALYEAKGAGRNRVIGEWEIKS